jgi:hypothetical protein
MQQGHAAGGATMNTIGRRCGWLAVLVGVIGGAMATGCGPSKPALYSLRGSVVDAGTKQGVSQVNLVLRALVVREGGAVATRATTTLVAYGMTDTDGKYEIELAEGFDVLRQARQIRLEASKNGYSLAAMDIPPPNRKEDFYKLPDVLMVRNNAVPWGRK